MENSYKMWVDMGITRDVKGTLLTLGQEMRIDEKIESAAIGENRGKSFKRVLKCKDNEKIK